MTRFRYEWQDEHGDYGTIIVEDDDSIALEIYDSNNESILHYLDAARARAIAGALLRAAQHIDPLPSTTPNPASTPDRLT